MADPIIEQIADKIKDLINEITTGNGFTYTLTAVRPKRLHLEGDINKDLSVIIEQDAEPELITYTNDKIKWRQPFALQAIVLDADDASTAIDTKLNYIRSDIEKKIFNSSNLTLDGLAERVLPYAVTKFIAAPNASGIAVIIDVVYFTDFDDPYTQS